jgi:hypothetical protein
MNNTVRPVTTFGLPCLHLSPALNPHPKPHNHIERQMVKNISLVLFLLVSVIVAPAAAEEPKVTAKPAERSLESREQEYPETAAMLDRITQIIKGGDLQDVSYLEKLFDVHFSEPTYFNHPVPSNGGPSLVRIERNTNPKWVDGVPAEHPAYTLHHRVDIWEAKEPPYPPPETLSLDISFSRQHICFRFTDFQPLFDTGPKDVAIADAEMIRFETSDGTKTVSLYVTEGLPMVSADKRLPVIGDDVNRGDCPVTSVAIDYSYVPTSRQNSGGLQ